MKIALLPLARSTFDVSFAQEKFDQALSVLKQTGYEIVGADKLLFEADETQRVIADLKHDEFDVLLLLQVTFTDASIAVKAAECFTQPLAIWAIPEPRIGGRLRLNAFCGLNLASHALSLRNKAFSYFYADPSDEVSDDLSALLTGSKQMTKQLPKPADNTYIEQGSVLYAALKKLKIARIGEHPIGFDTCHYDSVKFAENFPIAVEQIELNDFFALADSLPDEKISAVYQQASQDLSDLSTLNQQQLDKSLRLKAALDVLKDKRSVDAFAIRCWPETFTEYGGAVCGPISMMAEGGTPCACEADVYGSLSQLLMAQASEQTVFMADMVDMDSKDDTAVVWHCGQAPLSMASENFRRKATIHTNRKMPLLYEFPLKAGEVTFCRLSQGHGEVKLIIAKGEMLSRDKAFTGTSGVVRFDIPIMEVMKNIINSGLEHHMVLAYGDYQNQLEGFAAAIDLPVINLTRV